MNSESKKSPSNPCVMIAGAGSGVGRLLALECLNAGYSVVAQVRRVESAPELEQAGAQVVIGDALDQSIALKACQLAGSKAIVVSTLGGRSAYAKGDKPAANYLANRHFVDAAEQVGQQKMLLVTSIGCGDSWMDINQQTQDLLGHVLREKSLAESWLRSSSLDWMIIRPTGLNDQADSQAILLEGEAIPSHHLYIRRAALANQLLHLLSSASDASWRKIYTCIGREVGA